LLTAASVRDWYPTIQKPSWTPPSWVFMPVWTLLFVLMAVSAWLVWSRVGVLTARWGLALFLVQLALNAGWSGLFFALRRPDLAYLLWVTYATALNGTICWMNP
jgi:tryptophan-rich sensory protein